MAKKEKKQGTFTGIRLSHDECGSSDGLAVFEDEDGNHNGYCYVCKKFVRHVEGYSEEVNMSNTTSVNLFPVIRDVYTGGDINHRHINSGIVNYFGVKVLGDGFGNCQKIFYPRYNDGRLVEYKERDVATKGFTIHREAAAKGTEFFGQQQAALTGAKRLIITEGEDDAMCLFEVLWRAQQGTEYQNYNPAIVSVTDGAGAIKKNIANNPEFLGLFETIVLVMDKDEAGQEAIELAVSLLPPEKVRVVNLPKKDPCKMVEDGQAEALRKAVLFQAVKYKPSSIVTVGDIIEEAIKPPTWGPDWPFPSMTGLTFGIQFPFLMGVAAGVGVGKTNFQLKIIEHLMYKHGIGVGTFMLEQAPKKTLSHLVSKVAKRDFTRPDVEFDAVMYRQIADTFDPLISIYNHQGFKSWDDVKAAIRHVVVVEGRKVIVLDPITALVAQLSSSEANDELNKIFSDLASMIAELNFGVLYGAHLNAPEKGKPHEEGGRVRLKDLTGSKAMIKWSEYIFGIERDTQSEDSFLKNVSVIRNLKDREFGAQSKFYCFYEHETRDYYEINKPAQLEDQSQVGQEKPKF